MSWIVGGLGCRTEKWSMDKPQKIHDDKKIAATGQKCHITLLFWAKIREN